MAAQYLHIVAFNIPYPADYGGVIDVFFKVKSLSEAGVRIILHCFQYGRKPSKELEDLCFKVHYYPRKSGLRYHLQSDPYIIGTRNANSMPEHLLGDSFPVLFEGLHSTAMLRRCVQARKKTLVRAHNIEHLYYRALSSSERSLLKLLYFRREARKLQAYESLLEEADHVLGIAMHETEYFEQRYGNAHFIPAFHRFREVSAKEGSGDFILFHGDLSISDQTAAFLRLIRKTGAFAPVQLVVAGKNPSPGFQKRVSAFPNVRLISNPDDATLDDLLARAHIHLLLSNQSTGLKLKLLHALHAGRHCLVNPEMVKGSGLNGLCIVAASPEEMKTKVSELMATPFSKESILERKKVLKEYSNRTSAEKILRILA